MKVLSLTLLALVALCFSQSPNPTPIPSLNLTKISGLWYFVMYYPAEEVEGISCFTWNMTIRNDSYIKTGVNYIQSNITHSGTQHFQVTGNGAQWYDGDLNYDWLAVDPVNYSWGVIGITTEQAAVVISRTPTLSKAIVSAQIALLQKEGYALSHTNTTIIPNQCPSLDESEQALEDSDQIFDI